MMIPLQLPNKSSRPAQLQEQQRKRLRNQRLLRSHCHLNLHHRRKKEIQRSVKDMKARLQRKEQSASERRKRRKKRGSQNRRRTVLRKIVGKKRSNFSRGMTWALSCTIVHSRPLGSRTELANIESCDTPTNIPV